jgi:hypothetical protein
MLPVAAALLIVFLLWRMHETQPRAASWLVIVAMLAAGGNLADVCYRRSQLRLPGSFLQAHPEMRMGAGSWWGNVVQRADDDAPSGEAGAGAVGKAAATISPRQLFDDWTEVCAWIHDNTPSNAKFITPRHQQTFKWYAQRAEVATWKDVPQDAAAIVEWKRIREELYPAASARFDLAAHTPEQLAELAHKYGASYVVLDRRLAGRPLPWARVYPMFPGENHSYEVYRTPPPRVR